MTTPRQRNQEDKPEQLFSNGNGNNNDLMITCDHPAACAIGFGLLACCGGGVLGYRMGAPKDSKPTNCQKALATSGAVIGEGAGCGLGTALSLLLGVFEWATNPLVLTPECLGISIVSGCLGSFACTKGIFALTEKNSKKEPTRFIDLQEVAPQTSRMPQGKPPVPPKRQRAKPQGQAPVPPSRPPRPTTTIMQI